MGTRVDAACALAFFAALSEDDLLCASKTAVAIGLKPDIYFALYYKPITYTTIFVHTQNGENVTKRSSFDVVDNIRSCS
nr:hypothetical protein [Tanacetum cinerariifolium]